MVVALADAFALPVHAVGVGEKKNVQELAKLLETEAGDTRDQVAMPTIGFTVLERIRRNGVTSVHDVWDRYKHYKGRVAESFG